MPERSALMTATLPSLSNVTDRDHETRTGISLQQTALATAGGEPPSPDAGREIRWPSRVLDASVATVLLIVAVAIRRYGLPTDGLWHDDAWVAAGAVRGAPSEFFRVGSAHPGFTGSLTILSHLTGGDSRTLTYPAFVAGSLGAAALYLGLRLFGTVRSISALLGGALAVAPIHVLYSTRVRTYVVDPLIVLGIAAVLPRLARARWHARAAVAWVVAAVLISAFSGFALLAMAVAGLILFLHPASDRRIRFGALAAQAAACGALLWAEQRTFNASAVEANQERFYDGHLEFSLNPARYAEEVHEHFRRVTGVFPGGPGWFATISAIAAVIGLVTAASRREPRALVLRARCLAVVLLVAFLGGVTHQFPFGTTGGIWFSRGARANLWLLPVMALGCAFLLQQVRSFARARLLRAGFDVIVCSVAITVVLVGFHQSPKYPFQGAASATSFIESRLHPHDAVLLAFWTTYPYAVESQLHVSMRWQPHEVIGFAPLFADRRVHVIVEDRASITSAVHGAQHVFVPVTIVPYTPRALVNEQRRATLRSLGYRLESSVFFHEVEVEIWSRASAPQSS